MWYESLGFVNVVGCVYDMGNKRAVYMGRTEWDMFGKVGVNCSFCDYDGSHARHGRQETI
jgi:hypothetical protein